jgi:diguanylate cyclase (GGDEF)-like protein
MTYVFGIQLGETMPILRAFEFGLVASVVAPSLICPIVSFKIVMASQERDRANSRLAETDQLTGLLNRRGFDAAAQKAISRLSASESPVSALMIDIDFFKNVNDGFGHEFGDAALVHLAKILQNMALVQRFIVGRQGGEKFVVLLPGRKALEATSIAERLRYACCKTPVNCKGRSTSIAVSIGVSSQEPSVSLADLISQADSALYRAKRSGRNRVILHRSDVDLERVA